MSFAWGKQTSGSHGFFIRTPQAFHDDFHLFLRTPQAFHDDFHMPEVRRPHEKCVDLTKMRPKTNKLDFTLVKTRRTPETGSNRAHDHLKKDPTRVEETKNVTGLPSVADNTLRAG